MKHARWRKDREIAAAQTDRCDTARLRVRTERKCDTDGARRATDRQAGRQAGRQADRQTDRQGKNKIGSSVTWRKRAKAQMQQALHIFSYYSLLWLFWHSVSGSIFITFKHMCKIQTATTCVFYD